MNHDNDCTCNACLDRVNRAAAYAQGRADERAAIVRWLRELPTPLERIEYLAQSIERVEHER